MRLIPRVSVFCFIVFFLFAGSASADDLIIGNYQLVGSKRISRTVFEYTYTADVTNSGTQEYQDVGASVVSSSSNTVLMDSDLSFPDVEPGNTATSTDTFSFRQNRRYPLDWDDLTWTITGIPVAGGDTDGDGIDDVADNCPDVSNPDQVDVDNDGTGDVCDGCPNDSDKTEPGVCGCGTSDIDSDNDSTPDCNDICPSDSNKVEPGICGCGVADTDQDGDGIPDCSDSCPNDPDKTEPGICGCGTPDTDTDNDGTPDCTDNCPNDPNKIDQGICGCGISDIDSDNDGTSDCTDNCPNDPDKVDPGDCGCSVPEIDSDGDGIPDCIDDDNIVLPPDPSLVAPPIDPTVATTVFTASEFLYTGAEPIQTGVEEDKIKPKRTAVIHGKVKTRDGQVLPGVTVSVLNHSEFGQTLTRLDGMFDMVVNGGGRLIVSYEKAGYLPAQRSVEVPWQDHVWTPEVIMLPPDPHVTEIDLTESLMQVARGSVVTDDYGSRQATILFPPGIEAIMLMPLYLNPEPITVMHVRATEFTVGESGAEAMPAELPPSSAYTYAVELSVDEAIDAGACGVEFMNQQVIIYVENFLEFEVGGAVPTGYYDTLAGKWKPMNNGRIIEIISIDNNMAEVDIDGDGTADDAASLATIGITEEEQQQLASLYIPGQSLWRVRSNHFSPFDFNWPFGLPDDAEGSNQPGPKTNPPENRPCEQSGSIIECQNQVIGETVDIVGTPFSLNYRSDRVPGRVASYTADVSLSGDSIPASLLGIDLICSIGGKKYKSYYPALPNLSDTITWDGLDLYGRRLQGKQPLDIMIGYVYSGVWYDVPADWTRSFARTADTGVDGFSTNSWGMEITVWQKINEASLLGVVDVMGLGLGGWTISPHHVYDPQGHELYMGDGTRRSAQGIVPRSIKSITGWMPGGTGKGLAVSEDGTIYTTDGKYIYRIEEDGTYTIIAGTGQNSFNGDHLATSTNISAYDLAAGPGGSYKVQVYSYESGEYETRTYFNPILYFADTQNTRVRQLVPGPDTPDNPGVPGPLYVETIAGYATTAYLPGIPGYDGDELLATLTRVNMPQGVAVGPAGDIYIADTGNQRIRYISPDGFIHTIAGTGTAGYNGDNIPATQAQLNNPRRIKLGPDGSLYIADRDNNRIRKVSPDGIITTVAGTGTPGYSGDGGPAVQAMLNRPAGLELGPDGSLYISSFLHNTNNYRVRQVLPDGTIITIAGTGNLPTGQIVTPGERPTATDIIPIEALALKPDGKLFLGTQQSLLIVQDLPGFDENDIAIASEDGSELYRFNSEGRHLETINVLTGAVVYSFKYDPDGRLISITDGHGKVTTIERDPVTGYATAIIGPFGKTTNLVINTNGYLESVTNPAGEIHSFTYYEGGLLSSFEDPMHNVSDIYYDSEGMGLFVKEKDPEGGGVTLTRQELDDGYEVTMTSAGGRTNSYKVENLPNSAQTRTNTLQNNTQGTEEITDSGNRNINYPDGTTVAIDLGPDPRFGFKAPLLESLKTTTPGGLAKTRTLERSVTLTDPDDLLSLETLTDTIRVNYRTYTRSYDRSTNQWTLTSPMGRQSVITLNDQNQIVESLVPGFSPIQFIYNNDGLLTTVNQENGSDSRTSTVTYGIDGFAKVTTDPISRTITFERDPVGRVTKKTFHDGREVNASFDANGNLISLTPPGRPVHYFDYTPMGKIHLYTPPDIGIGNTSTQFTYNLDHDIELETRPDGKVGEYEYDTEGRVGDILVDEGEYNFTYDPTHGRLSSITSPGGVVLSYTYDGSLLLNTTWSGEINGTVSRTYNNNFWIYTQSVNGSPIYLNYDNDGLLTYAGYLTLTRDSGSGLLQDTTLGYITDHRDYNSFTEIVGYNVQYSSSDIFDTDYTLNRLGKLTDRTVTIDSATVNTHYEYDLAGRLTKVSNDGVLTASYTYDDNGNRISHTGISGVVSGTYDDQDRMIIYGDNSYTYTANGDLLAKTNNGETTYYEYDEAGNLMNVELPDGTQIEYIMDGRNRRVGKKLDGTLVQGFLYTNRINVVAELNADGSVLSRFVYGSCDHVPDYMVKSGSTYRIISDSLGSPRIVINAYTGAVLQRMDYDEFGNVILDTNPGFQPFGFAGGIYDRDTGLTRFGVRDYDAETGRWTTKDPVLFAGEDTNVYVYCLNDPVNLIDPFGNEAKEYTFKGDLPGQEFYVKEGENGETYVRETYETENGTYVREDAYNPNTDEVVSSSTEVETSGGSPPDAGDLTKDGSAVENQFDKWKDRPKPKKTDGKPTDDEGWNNMEDLPDGPDIDKVINDEDLKKYDPC